MVLKWRIWGNHVDTCACAVPFSEVKWRTVYVHDTTAIWLSWVCHMYPSTLRISQSSHGFKRMRAVDSFLSLKLQEDKPNLLRCWQIGYVHATFWLRLQVAEDPVGQFGVSLSLSLASMGVQWESHAGWQKRCNLQATPKIRLLLFWVSLFWIETITASRGWRCLDPQMDRIKLGYVFYILSEYETTQLGSTWKRRVSYLKLLSFKSLDLMCVFWGGKQSRLLRTLTVQVMFVEVDDREIGCHTYQNSLQHMISMSCSPS